MTVEQFDSQRPLQSVNKASNNIANQTIILETPVKVLAEQSKARFNMIQIEQQK
jgi:hypothetical protein